MNKLLIIYAFLCFSLISQGQDSCYVSGKTSLYAKPDLNSEKIELIEKTTFVLVIDKKNNFYLAEVNNKKGYLQIPFVICDELKELGTTISKRNNSKTTHTYKSTIILSTPIELSESEGKGWKRINQNKKWKIWTERGFLHELKEKSIVYSSSSDISLPNNILTEYNVEHIKKLKFYKKGRVAKSLLIGSGIGFALGAIGGQSLYEISAIKEEESRWKWIALSGIGGAFCGGLIGGIISILKVNITIDGDFNKYQQQQRKLEKYMLQH